MGTLYFVLKNTVITFVIVSFLQLEIGGKSLETHLMKRVRKTLAPKFLGQDPIEIDGKIKLSKEQVNSLQEKIKESDMYKDAKAGVKEALLEEVQSLFKEEGVSGSEDEQE